MPLVLAYIRGNQIPSGLKIYVCINWHRPWFQMHMREVETKGLVITRIDVSDTRTENPSFGAPPSFTFTFGTGLAMLPPKSGESEVIQGRFKRLRFSLGKLQLFGPFLEQRRLQISKNLRVIPSDGESRRNIGCDMSEWRKAAINVADDHTGLAKIFCFFWIRDMDSVIHPCAKSVPWRTWREWARAYESILNPSLSQKFRSIPILQEWRNRGKLPISVDATLSILEIMRKDPVLMSEDFGSQCFAPSELSLLYGLAITRFVNLIIDVQQKGSMAANMELVGASIEIPNWIIQVRHVATHGTNIPPIFVLRRAANELLVGFLIPKYWMRQHNLLSNESFSLEGGTAKQLSTTEVLAVSATDDRASFSGKRVDNMGFLHFVSTSHSTDPDESIVQIFSSLDWETKRVFLQMLVRYHNLPVLQFLISHSETGYESKGVILSILASAKYEDVKEVFRVLGNEGKHSGASASTEGSHYFPDRYLGIW